MYVFWFKLWRMTQRIGTFAQDVPFKTQFLIVEGRDGSDGDQEPESAMYVVFLPILEGDFRAVLQGNANNDLEICLESESYEVCELYCGKVVDEEKCDEALIGHLIGIDVPTSGLSEVQEDWESRCKPYTAELFEFNPCVKNLDSSFKQKLRLFPDGNIISDVSL